jgi:plastocyanin
MDYSQILKDLDEATSFDLYRLVSALEDEMESAQRIKKVRSGLRVGQAITWFDKDTHKLVESKILKLNKTRCLVRNFGDGVKWNITYASINTEDEAVEINMNQKYGVKKSELKIGDTVTYVSKDNVQLFGTVVKLNQKTAGIKTINGQKWRVSYGFLKKVIEIEGEIIHRKFIEG